MKDSYIPFVQRWADYRLKEQLPNARICDFHDTLYDPLLVPTRSIFARSIPTMEDAKWYQVEPGGACYEKPIQEFMSTEYGRRYLTNQ